MSNTSNEQWHIITYDIREPERWRKIYRLMRGHGDRIQYSVFRVRASPRQLERLRWELERLMGEDDDLLVITLCASCGARVKARHSEDAWSDEPMVRFSD